MLNFCPIKVATVLTSLKEHPYTAIGVKIFPKIQSNERVKGKCDQ